MTYLAQSALLISPSRPTVIDLETLESLDALVKEAKDLNPGLKGFVVINDAKRELIRVEKEFLHTGFKHITLLNASIPTRQSYTDGYPYGLSAWEMSEVKPEPSKPKLATELEKDMADIWDEIVKHLKYSNAA